MADRPRDDGSREEREERSPLPGDGSEPEWARQIRSLRRSRIERLKEAFANLDDEEER